MPRGHLRVYLGVAPGAGVTHALLDEGTRRRARGTDVVLGALDARGRTSLTALAGGLDVVGSGAGLDVDAVLRRRPAVVLIDNLAEPSVADDPTTPARWTGAERLVAAGIDVVGTADVRTIASLQEAVERVTGERPDRALPDRFLRQADQVQLVDITPQALRRRLAHGGLYGPEDLDAVRSAGLRPGALGGLRELALRWMLDAVPGQHDAWVRSLGDGEMRPRAGEHLVVGLADGAATAEVLHRAVRLAGASPGAELVAVHVLAESSPGAPARDSAPLRRLAEEMGVRYQEVVGNDVAAALVEIARAEQATQIVLGAGQRPSARPWLWTVRGDPAATDVAAQVVALADPGMDVHVLTTGAPTSAVAMPATRRGLSRPRLFSGFVLALLLPAVLTLLLLHVDVRVGLAGDSLILLLGVVVTSLVGGLWPAVIGAVVGSTMLNFFFIPPVRTFRVAESHDVVTLVVFVVVAILVSAVVHRAAWTSTEAARASAESRTLSAVASSALHGDDALPALLDQLCAAFGMRAAALLEQPPGADDRWVAVAARGVGAPNRPEEADVQVAAGTGRVLALSGRTLAAADRRVLQAFAAAAQGLIERDALARGAAVAERLEATERLRDALLAAVGHDLRTPLASAIAAVSSLRSRDVRWTDAEREELLETAEESLARLGRLVADLLDLSRLRAGALMVRCEPVWLDEVIPFALDELGEPARAVQLRIAGELPAAQADAALLIRVLVNVTGNALRYAPPGRPPLIAASATADRVEVRVVDRGPGIPTEDLDRVFVAFQRLGDTDNSAGLGLGLALSKGLVEAMSGTITAEETPGGGLTMVIGLPVATSPGDAGPAEPGRRERQEGS